MLIRAFQQGDARALWEVFYSAIHVTASADYSPEQVEAWAPHEVDIAKWTSRMQVIAPFVVEDLDNKIIGYADVQQTGYIDHFFVSPEVSRQGVGTLLMRKIHETATRRAIASLFSDVSITAKPFFERWGFNVESPQTVVIRGVKLGNFKMRKTLLTES